MITQNDINNYRPNFLRWRFDDPELNRWYNAYYRERERIKEGKGDGISISFIIRKCLEAEARIRESYS